MPILESGQKLAFLGASITAEGWEHPHGYLHLIVDILARNGIVVTPIPAGVGGNTSGDMLARLERDVLAHKPDSMALDAGRNDVWHGGVSLDAYQRNMTAIVDRAQAAGVRVLLQTITPIGEEIDNEFNQKLAPFNAFVKELAAEKQCPLTDLNAAATEALKNKTGTEFLLTVDGVHMNERGDRLIATGILKTMGLTDAQIGAVAKK